MKCAPTCICRCQQSGCGCRAAEVTEQTPSRPVGQTAPCSLCGGRADARFVTTPLGDRVVVIWCWTCDAPRSA